MRVESEIGGDRVFKERILVTILQQGFERRLFYYNKLIPEMCKILIEFPGSIIKNPVFIKKI